MWTHNNLKQRGMTEQAQDRVTCVDLTSMIRFGHQMEDMEHNNNNNNKLGSSDDKQ
jgi:hypothetical protein